MNSEKLTIFDGQKVSFVETMKVKEGVTCDVYSFDSDDSRDLGIVTVLMGNKTPFQKILLGDKTIEGFISGAGILTIQNESEEIQKYEFPNITSPQEVEVKVGELMQWEADSRTDLMFYEVCYPPYKDGRYENF